MDEGFLGRLAIAVQEARGKMSQREFAEVLGVSQSTVQQWENGKNVPSVENLEKIARIKGMLVEDFVAYLYGRNRGVSSKDILDRIEVMPSLPRFCSGDAGDGRSHGYRKECASSGEAGEKEQRHRATGNTGTARVAGAGGGGRKGG